MNCEGFRKKGSSGTISSCTFMFYANPNQIGASVPIRIQTASWLFGKNNSMEDPRDGENLIIYDNDGNPISLNNKLRIFGQLDNADKCVLGGVERIDHIP